jgi:hypothetical protein
MMTPASSWIPATQQHIETMICCQLPTECSANAFVSAGHQDAPQSHGWGPPTAPAASNQKEAAQGNPLSHGKLSMVGLELPRGFKVFGFDHQ